MAKVFGKVWRGGALGRLFLVLLVTAHADGYSRYARSETEGRVRARELRAWNAHHEPPGLEELNYRVFQLDRINIAAIHRSDQTASHIKSA